MKDYMRVLFSGYEYKPCDAHFTGQDPDEEVLLLLRRHIITNLPWVFLTFLLLSVPFLLGFALSLFESISGISFESISLPGSYTFLLIMFWYLISFTFLFESYLNWYANVYIVSNKKIIDVDFFGILHVSVTQAPITNVEDVTYSVSGVVETMLDFGRVEVQTAGEKENIDFEYVPKPAHVQDVIADLATLRRKG